MCKYHLLSCVGKKSRKEMSFLSSTVCLIHHWWTDQVRKTLSKSGTQLSQRIWYIDINIIRINFHGCRHCVFFRGVCAANERNSRFHCAVSQYCQPDDNKLPTTITVVITEGWCEGHNNLGCYSYFSINVIILNSIKIINNSNNRWCCYDKG